jgi:hypothetical protein
LKRALLRLPVLEVKHSMVLEDQMVGRMDETVKSETGRIVRKRFTS